MDHFYAGLVVWASARGDIFWPGQVVEPDEGVAVSAKKCVTINFLIEDSYEDIKNPNKIFIWNCEKQKKFIEKGRGIGNLEKKVQFNKAVAKADNLFMLQEKKGDDMSLHDNEKITNSPTENRKIQSNKKNRSGGERSMPLRTSPRKKITNEKLTSNAENQCSRLIDVQPAVQSAINGSETEKEMETMKRCYSASKLQTKSKEADSLKCNVKRRKTLQGQSKNSTPAKKNSDKSIDSLEVRCNGHQKAKRRLIDDEPPKKRVSPKKAKPSHRAEKSPENNKNVELSSKRTLKVNHQNGVEEKESLEINSENNVDDSTEAVFKVSEAVVGINSSVSSDGSSDDELLSDAFSPSQEANQFSVGDIVWAKYSREPYWPAQIKKVTGKRKYDQKFVVKFLAWNNGLFRVQPKKLEHFACDPTQRAEFMGIIDTLKNKELKEPFKEALIEAEDLLNRKGLGKSLEEELYEDESEIFEEKEDECADHDDKQIADVPEQTSLLFECRKSLRAKKQVSKYSNILSYIRQAKPFLRQILNGTKRSERHRIYTCGRVSEKDQLKHRAGFGPIGDENLREEIMTMLVEFYTEINGNMGITYVSEVWLPEAIIFAIQEIDKVKRRRAEEMYQAGSEIAVSSSEVQEWTKKFQQRRLSPEETQERVKKAERALARYGAAES